MKFKKLLSVLLLASMLVSSLALPAFAEERTEAATNVIEMIMALDENTKPEQFAAVKNAYNALTPEEQATVYNYETLVEFENQYAIALNNELAAIKEIEIDLFNGEQVVESLAARYDSLSDGAKALVTETAKLESLLAKLDALRSWGENRKVNILNSTMHGLAAYDFDYVRSLLDQPSEGIYYYFEEVGYLDRGDPTTGYYDLEFDNAKVENYKYSRLEVDMIITDLDFTAGWPALKTLVSNDEGMPWSGYDFVNGVYFTANITKWGQGSFIKHRSTEEGTFDLGVWHHLSIVYDEEKLTYTLDGEVVYDTEYDGTYRFFIIYPWLCNLEMTNVRWFDRYGNETLSPFRTHVNVPTGWSRASNEEGATMLDLIEQSVDNARTMYNSLTEDQKAEVADAGQIERVQTLIDAVRAGKFPVTVEGGSADKDSAEFNTTVTVTADAAPEGKIFDKWIVEPEMTLLEKVEPDEVPADLTKATISFAMPDNALKLTATYKDKPPFTPGDANDDGKLNAKDVTAIMKHLVGATPVKFVELAADFDGNGKINAKDVTALMKFLVKA